MALRNEVGNRFSQISEISSFCSQWFISLHTHEHENRCFQFNQATFAIIHALLPVAYCCVNTKCIQIASLINVMHNNKWALTKNIATFMESCIQIVIFIFIECCLFDSGHETSSQQNRAICLVSVTTNTPVWMKRRGAFHIRLNLEMNYDKFHILHSHAIFIFSKCFTFGSVESIWPWLL